MKKAVIKLYTASELTGDAFAHAWAAHNFAMGKTRKPEEFIEDSKDALFLSNGAPWQVIDAEDGDIVDKNGLTRGLALAVNYMLRHNSASDIWSAGGMSIRECIAIGVADFDLEKLIPEYAQPEDAEAIAGYWLKTFAEDTEKHINADEFLTALNFELMARTHNKTEDQDTDSDKLITDMRTAFIGIVKEIENI